MASAEYLKKYLEAPKETGDHKIRKKKRRKKSAAAAVQNMKILDEDEFVSTTASTTAPINSPMDELLDDAEGPVVVEMQEDNLGSKHAPVGTWTSIDNNNNNNSAHQRHDSDSEDDGGRRRRHDSDDEADNEDDDGDMSPPRRRVRHDSDSEDGQNAANASEDDSDMSPPRRHTRARADASDDTDDLSPPRRAAVADSDSGSSPPRRRRPRRSDSLSADDAVNEQAAHVDAARMASLDDNQRQLLVLRAKAAKRKAATAAAQAADGDGDQSGDNAGGDAKRQKMESGALAGLLSGAELAADIARVQAEEEARFAAMDPVALGRDAEVVLRDRKGRVVSKADLEANAEAAAQKAADDKVNMEWGRGLTQRDEAKRRAAALAAAREGPFARRREDLDDDQKARGRWGDPMLGMAGGDTSDKKQKKKSKKSKKDKKQGGVAAVLGALATRRYNGPSPANRFDIAPGALWDGVDRSNGFEVQYFAMKAAQKAGSTERYHWSVENM